MFRHLWSGVVTTCAMLLVLVLAWLILTITVLGLTITSPLWVVVFAHMSVKTRSAKDFFAQTIKSVEDLDWERIFDNVE